MSPSEPIVAKPVLPVADVPVAAAFYRALGFEVTAYDDGYAWVLHRGEEVVHLRRVDGIDVAANAAGAYLHVQRVDDWYAAMAGSIALTPPTDMPWGMREFSFTDPSGNVVRVGSNR